MTPILSKEIEKNNQISSTSSNNICYENKMKFRPHSTHFCSLQSNSLIPNNEFNKEKNNKCLYDYYMETNSLLFTSDQTSCKPTITIKTLKLIQKIIGIWKCILHNFYNYVSLY